MASADVRIAGGGKDRGPAGVSVVLPHKVAVPILDRASGRLRLVAEEMRTPVVLRRIDPATGSRRRVHVGVREREFMVHGRGLWERTSVRLPGGDGGGDGFSIGSQGGSPFAPLTLSHLADPGGRPSRGSLVPDEAEAGRLRTAAAEAIVRHVAARVAHDAGDVLLRRPVPLLLFGFRGASAVPERICELVRSAVPHAFVDAVRRHGEAVFGFMPGSGASHSPDFVARRLEGQVGDLADDGEWLRLQANELPCLIVDRMQGARAGRLAPCIAEHVARLAPFVARGAVGTLDEDEFGDCLAACLAAIPAAAGACRRQDERKQMDYLERIVGDVSLPALRRLRPIPAEDAAGLSALAP